MYKTRHIVTLFCIYSISANNSSFCLRLEKRERKKERKRKENLLESPHEIETSKIP